MAWVDKNGPMSMSEYRYNDEHREAEMQ